VVLEAARSDLAANGRRRSAGRRRRTRSEKPRWIASVELTQSKFAWAFDDRDVIDLTEAQIGHEEEKYEMAKVRLYSADISRRNVLRGVAGAAVVAATGERAFAAKPKRAQADVAYQDHPHGDERCENCEPFLPPNQCKTVEGPVTAKGWCKIYSAKS
jgi:hypothetical protein